MKSRTCICFSLIYPLMLVEVCFAVSPKVVRTIPGNGDMNVKPGQVKVSIYFDQDMSQYGYSITGGGENFPQIIGRPQWVGKRTITFLARLQPDRQYTFGVNSPTYQNFRNTQGEPADFYVVSFKTTAFEEAVTAAKDVNEHREQLTEEQNETSINELKDALKKFYSYNDLKNINWNLAFARQELKLLNAKTREEFARLAGQVLAAAKDKHIWLEVGGKQIQSYVNPVAPNVDFRLLPNLIPDFNKHNDIVCSGRFSDGIGYILIDSWVVNDENDFEPLFTALQDFNNPPGLIIDVRGNGGGSEPMAQKFAGCFINQERVYAKSVSVELGSPGGFSAVQERRIRPTEGRPEYRGKVAVLTGPVVISSCEAFVLMMKQVPGCLIIGEPTQGSSGNPKPHNLTNGVTVYLPSWKAMLPDGTCFEGKGIQPDILVKWAGVSAGRQTPDIFGWITSQVKVDTPATPAGQDNVLDAALKELRKK